jgi:uncharacterized protein involved in exopolysaccharide biosynthesis
MTAANEALSTDTPATVTFDTLSAAQELRKTGFEDRQAEAIVSTVSKAMSETVATKADLELQSAVTKADIEAMGAELRAGTQALRAELKADNEALRTEFKLFRQSVDSRFEKVDLRSDTLEKSLRQEMAALENRLILKLGGLMVTMAFLLLAIGPFYIRWVLSLMGLS